MTDIALPEASVLPGRRTLLDMNAYQWTVIFAAWLGWGFDVFDGLLFTYVAPNAVPALLHIAIGSAEARQATLFWVGVMNAALLLGWAAGGILFGKVADRIGRTRTLLLTMAIYSLGTASCALAPNLGVLLLCRLVASLGIGGEWAAGAAMVAEVVPEKRRVEAGALLYTSSPLGLFLASFATYQIAGVLFKGSPETSWRWVLLCGLLPAIVAVFVRRFVKEPDRWKEAAAGGKPPAISELFSPEYRALTFSGFCVAVTALVVWWSSNSFIPTISTGLAQVSAKMQGLDPAAALALSESWKAIATNSFNLGGLIGTLLTIPAGRLLTRRKMFALYFIVSAVSMMIAFGTKLNPQVRLYLYFPIGLSTFGIFGSFTYYLTELFPTRLRATGAGFCYNIGRILAAGGVFVVGRVASMGADSLDRATDILFWVGLIPVLGLLLLPWVVDTHRQTLTD